MTIISDLLHAGVAPDLVARVADAIEAARSEGVDMSLRAMRSEGAGRQARYRDRKRNVTNDVRSDVTNDVTSDATPSRTRAFSIGEEVDITPLGSLRSPTLPKGSDDVKSQPRRRRARLRPQPWALGCSAPRGTGSVQGLLARRPWPARPETGLGGNLSQPAARHRCASSTEEIKWLSETINF